MSIERSAGLVVRFIAGIDNGGKSGCNHSFKSTVNDFCLIVLKLLILMKIPFHVLLIHGKIACNGHS